MKKIKIIIEQSRWAGEDRYKIVSLTNAATVVATKHRTPATCGSSLSVDQVASLCESPDYETTINYIPNK